MELSDEGLQDQDRLGPSSRPRAVHSSLRPQGALILSARPGGAPGNCLPVGWGPDVGK